MKTEWYFLNIFVIIHHNMDILLINFLEKILKSICNLRQLYFDLWESGSLIMIKGFR